MSSDPPVTFFVGQAYKAHEFLSEATLHVTSAKASFVHFGITSVLLAIGFVVANIIPFFADMQVSRTGKEATLSSFSLWVTAPTLGLSLSLFVFSGSDCGLCCFSHCVLLPGLLLLQVVQECWGLGQGARLRKRLVGDHDLRHHSHLFLRWPRELHQGNRGQLERSGEALCLQRELVVRHNQKD